MNNGPGLGIDSLNPGSPLRLYVIDGGTEVQRGGELLDITSCNAIPLELNLAADLSP